MTALDERRLTRRQASDLKRDSYWQTRFEAAMTPAERASTAWDHARARIKKLPAAEQEAAYERAFYALDQIARREHRS